LNERQQCQHLLRSSMSQRHPTNHAQLTRYTRYDEF
jgi:hypothetical protein